MIREAHMGDYPRFLDLTKRFRERLVTYPDCDIDPASVVQTFGRCVASRLNLALIAEHGPRITGALLAITQELWWSRAREATDVMFYSERAGDGVKMMKRFLAWAPTVPRVKVITLAHSSGEDLDRLADFYERLGLKRIGSLHQLHV